jgi:hypothetical protein
VPIAAAGWAKAHQRRAHHLAHYSGRRARFRLGSWSYGGQVALPIPRWLLLGWADKGAAKALRFAPRLTNVVPKTSEPGCQVDDDECDHDYWPGLTSRRLI